MKIDHSKQTFIQNQQQQQQQQSIIHVRCFSVFIVVVQISKIEILVRLKAIKYFCKI